MSTLTPEYIARQVSLSLRRELEAFPKPGLVSFVDSGSHPDMDARCFLDSIECLEPFFFRMALAGGHGAGIPELQKIGVQAEQEMLRVTGGRNTHRGAVFCLGLLAAAAGWRAGSGEPETLGWIVSSRWGSAIVPPERCPAVSDGSAMWQQYGVEGARGEAKRGFPSVYKTGLPALESALQKVGLPAAAVQVFFEILIRCEDTTLLKRGGAEGRDFAIREAAGFLESGGVLREGWKEMAIKIHREFIKRHLTAGGTADLLAATLFVHDLEAAR